MKYTLVLISLRYSSIRNVAKPVTIIVGGDKNMDACSSLAIVTKLKADLVEGYLAARSEPSINHPIVDKLAHGKRPWI